MFPECLCFSCCCRFADDGHGTALLSMQSQQAFSHHGDALLASLGYGSNVTTCTSSRSYVWHSVGNQISQAVSYVGLVFEVADRDLFLHF